MRIFCASLLAVLAVLPATAQADLTLGFSSDELNITVGQTVSIDILATQTDNDDLILNGDIRAEADGLVLAGMGLESSVPTVASSVFVMAGLGFSDSIITPSTPSELYIESERIDANIPTFAPNTDPTSLVLGTYNFTGQSAGTTTLTLVDPSVFDDWVFGGDEGGNDAAVFAGARPLTINVSAIPEPSSFVMVGCIAGLAMWRRQRTA